MRSPQHWRTGCCPVSSHLRVGSLPNGNWRWTSESADRSCGKHFARSSNAVSSTSNPAEGAFVHGDTGPRRFPPLDLEYRRRGTTARQLSEARLMLEMEAAALATEHADEDDLSNMEMALKRLEGSATPLERVRNDLSFHISLVAAAHNPVIETMFASIQTLTVELMVRSAADENIIRQSAPITASPSRRFEIGTRRPQEPRYVHI